MIIDTTSWILAGVGGVLIGLASVALMAWNGRIAGISGITNGVLFRSKGDTAWKALFLAGMIAGGFATYLVYPEAFPTSESIPRSLPALAIAGVLVGFGTRLGSGCTSGHGVCGMSRFSARSIVATLTFMATGAAVVALVRFGFGGAV